MTKHIINIIFLLVPVLYFAQDKKEKVWKNEKDYLEYRKTDKYEGPNDWYGSYPADMKTESDENTSGYGSSGNNGNQYNPGVQYTPQQIQKDRQKRYKGYDRGGGKGTLKRDPKVEEPDPIEIPDVDAPDIDLPNVDLDAPSIPLGFWKILLFIIIGALILWLAYVLIKNKKAPNQKVVIDVENDWNPEVITKTELELRLEEAMLKEDYRECVRIYFTFILKELIRKSWISWKKEKTNYHYVLEMHKRENAAHFNECVRVYDIVWYGEYQIDREIFELLKPTFENYYKSLDPVNE